VRLETGLEGKGKERGGGKKGKENKRKEQEMTMNMYFNFTFIKRKQTQQSPIIKHRTLNKEQDRSLNKGQDRPEPVALKHERWKIYFVYKQKLLELNKQSAQVTSVLVSKNDAESTSYRPKWLGGTDFCCCV
jgi:hypothetical protein